ncbi:uncharacterized protein A4U43_UnF5890 [Asparagus officinalis]|uniref:S-locus receptor kinase C-terminal domain-containing protein n=1 Tax=Asparagus officinalis TaxID=4686 RepID=A0A1R3L6K8_ASPOF|nr:uncharacterized protein A4U43_UnF5890 [Asparagus officinalis]
MKYSSASPLSEFARVNLISWARHLAHLGRLLDLVDPSIKRIDKEQALLCITVALLCIQRSPASCPSIKEIIGMLTGQSDPPHLPIEFSPSPPGGFSFKSRKKARWLSECMNSISSIGRNLVVSSKVKDDEDCEYEMIWDEEGYWLDLMGIVCT